MISRYDHERKCRFFLGRSKVTSAISISSRAELPLTSVSPRRQLGQLFMMGFDGTTINDQIRVLIEQYYVGSILLTAKNLKCAVACFHVYSDDVD